MKTILSLLLAAVTLNLHAQTADTMAVPVTFVVLDEAPLFPGCEGAEDEERITCFSEKAEAFVQKLLRYPEQARKSRKEGVVFVSFTVNTEGRIENVRLNQASSAPGYGLEEEALRAVALLPAMLPARLANKPVAFTYTIAVPFKLEKAAKGSAEK